jgi:hypothetical protein
MSNDQVGKYIRLLCLQHQKKTLSENDMLKICGTHDPDIWEKFEVVDGRFINRRMFDESEKRRNFSESRRKNRLKQSSEEHMINTCSTHVEHMENENENENTIQNENEIVLTRNNEKTIVRKSIFQKPEKIDLISYFRDQGFESEADNFFDYYESNGWHVGKQKMKDWRAAVRNWIRNANKFKPKSNKSNFEQHVEHHNESIEWAKQFDAINGIESVSASQTIPVDEKRISG